MHLLNENELAESAPKNLIPAFRCYVGDWIYFVCKMKYKHVNEHIGFAHEMGGNKDLNTLLQRGINRKRALQISDYLIQAEHRFLGPLVVAVWGGKPIYTPLIIEKDSDLKEANIMLDILDEDFGYIKFDGSQKYFALDGQHRLLAIKETLNKEPELGDEDISIILVAHHDDDEGVIRTRRLFTDINKNAKPTSSSENIALDENNPVAIITRLAINKHELFSGKQNLIKVFSSQKSHGEYKLASGSINPLDRESFTTIKTLFDCYENLAFDIDLSNYNRFSEDEILELYSKISKRFDDILKSADNLYEKLKDIDDMKDLRSPDSKPSDGHSLMRPIVQRTICKTIKNIFKKIEYSDSKWQVLLERISHLKWSMDSNPWLIVYNDRTFKMDDASEKKDLMAKAVKIHLFPETEEEILSFYEDYEKIFDSPYSQDINHFNEMIMN